MSDYKDIFDYMSKEETSKYNIRNRHDNPEATKNYVRISVGLTDTAKTFCTGLLIGL